MKFTKEAFDLVLANPKYEGAKTYLVGDNKEKLDYHIYICVVESGNVACIICEKLPKEEGTNNYEIYEFNGNKLLEHNVVRINLLDNKTDKYKMLIDRFTNKKFG